MPLVPNGDSVLIFGADPTIQPSLVPVDVPSSRILFLPNTRKPIVELSKWIANSQEKFDWSRYFKYVAVLEGKR